MKTLGIAMTATCIPPGAMGKYLYVHGDRTMDDEGDLEGFPDSAAEIPNSFLAFRGNSG